MPKENTDSEIITIIGKKADAEKARNMIHDIEKQLQNYELKVKIESELHPGLVGNDDGLRVKKLQGRDTNQYIAEQYIAAIY